MAVSQEEFFQSLGRPVDPDAPEAVPLKFDKMGVPHQGIVQDVIPTTEKGFGSAPDPKKADGSPKPALFVIIKLQDGTLGKIFIKGAALYVLKEVMFKQGLKVLPVGAMFGIVWTHEKEFNGFMAKQYQVQIKVPE